MHPLIPANPRMSNRSKPSIAGTLAALTLCLLALSTSLEAQAGRTPKIDLDRPWLRNLSTWTQQLRQAEGEKVEKRIRGVFPVGDGHVFAYQGLGRRANHMQGMSGPSYQTAEVSAPQGHWGEMVLDVLDAEGKAIALPRQSLWRTRGVNTLFSEDASDDGSTSLSTLTYASFGSKTLWRIVEVENGHSAARDLAVRVTWSRGRAGADGTSLVASEARKGFEAELLASRPGTIDANTMTIRVGQVAPGARARFVVALRTRTRNDARDTAGLDERAAMSALELCKNHWSQKLAGTMQTRIEDRRLTDLLEDWKVLMLVQRCAHSGAVAPMVNYRGSWIRDNTGPILAFLRYGLFEEAKGILDYIYKATLVTGTLQNHFPLDLDVSKASEIEKTIRWTDLRIPPTELAAWVILQHEWYYRATWDIEFLKARWPFLSMCYQALRPAADSSFSTHGDETYLHGAFYSLWPDRIGMKASGENPLLPADSPERRARSFDNSMLYLVVVNAMAELIEDLDKDAAGEAATKEGWGSPRKGAYDSYHVNYLLKLEEKFWDPRAGRFAPFASPITGQLHPAPYAPVNLRLQWIGYTYAIGEKNRQNLKSTLDQLWQKDGRVGMTPTTGYVTGSVQGLLLYSLADLEDQRRDEALQALVKMAGPAGEWGELYDPEGYPIAGYNADWPNRLRPWESGINIDAIFFALNGIRYVTCPGWSKKDVRMKLRVPGSSTWMTMRGAQHDAHRFNIFVDRVYRPDYDADEPTGVPESRMRFRVEYDHINKKAANLDWIDAAINVGSTLYMRLPTLEAPVYEITSWPEDDEQHWLPREGKGNWTNRVPDPMSGRNLLLTSRLDGPPVQSRVDFGMPLSADDLRGLLLRDGKPRYQTVLLDVGVTQPGRATMKSRAWWDDAGVRAAMADYVAQGGKLVDTPFVQNWSVLAPLPATGIGALRSDLPGLQSKDYSEPVTVSGKSVAWRTAKSSKIELGPDALGPTGAVALVGATVEADATREVILKVGCSVPFKAFVDGKEIGLGSTTPGSDRPDRFEGLVRLEKGKHRLVFAVWAPEGRVALRARFTGSDGMPLDLEAK